jgi:hypothetical protein
MGTKALPSQERKRQPAVYRRRRLTVLVAGLATLAVISWTFSGALHGRSPGPATRSDGGTAAGGSWPTPAAGVSSGASGGSALASAGRSGGTSSGRSAGRSTGAGSAAFSQINRCARKYVVLTLFAPQNDADPHGESQFEVYVVSTEAQTCKFNVGASRLALVIKSGATRVWSSADCPDGQGSLITELQRGVPTVVPIVWGRQRATAGCTGAPPAAPAGSYSATATDDGLISNTDTFRLR